MDVILLQRIEKLGQMGQVVRVKPGFARNYLLPQKKALRATDANRSRFEKQRAQLEATNLARRQEAEGISGQVDGLKIVIIRQAGETGHLYGSVSARDVAQAVTEGGVTIDRSQVLMDRPIKMLGLYPIRVALHPEVIVSVSANVAKSHEEAAHQEKAGGFVQSAAAGGPSLEDMLAEAETARIAQTGEIPAAEPAHAAEPEKAAEAAEADKPKKKKKKE